MKNRKLIVGLIALSAVFLSACQPIPVSPDDTANDADDTNVDDTDTTVDEPRTMSVQVYFGNNIENPAAQDCSAVFPVTREIAETDDDEEKIKLAMEELVKGPTEEEITEGATSFFSASTEELLADVELRSGIAYINFKTDLRETIPNASSSCGSQQFLSEINETVNQFGITTVRYSFDGNPQSFYEWLQLSCPTDYTECRNENEA